MTKEEILELSKRENVQEYEASIQKKAQKIVIHILFGICISVFFLEMFVYEDLEGLNLISNTLWVVFCVICATLNFTSYHYFKKKTELIFGIIETIICAINIASIIVHFMV